MKYSLLDLAPVTEEGTAATALHNAADIAQHADKVGLLSLLDGGAS